MIPISKIGPLQIRDILASKGIVHFDRWARICTVLKGGHDRGDNSPHRFAKLFGGAWQQYNNHFVIQTACCPFKCPYCYVDNLNNDIQLAPMQLVQMYIKYKMQSPCDVNVFHLMGGAPAMYCEFLPAIRSALDIVGLGDTILFTDTILVENSLYGVKPWEYMKLHHFCMVGCLKGTDPGDFVKNTGVDMFDEAMRELSYYIGHKNFYLTLINYKPSALPGILDLLHRYGARQGQVDLLKVIDYIASKRK